MLTDTKETYGWISVFLHWGGAVAVIALFLLGERMEDLPRGPERLAALNLHVSVGVSVIALLAARLIWRLIHGFPEKPSQPAALNLLSSLVVYGFLLAITVLIISGPLMQFSGGRPLEVFGLFQIASPMPRVEWLHETLEDIHDFAAHALIPLLVLHVLGVVKHIVIDRDGTFRRMVRAGSRLAN